MRHSHNQSRARVRVQHQPYPSAIFDTRASLKRTTEHVRCFLRTVVHVFFLYLTLLLAVWISAQLITPLSGAEVPVSDPDWPNSDLFNGSMDDMWHHVEQDEECFHCLFENWMKDDPGMSDLLSCPLSDEVTTVPVHVRSTHLLLSMKHCTAFNAMFRRMTILVITFVRQVAVSLLVTFLGLSTILCEEMLAHSATGKKGKKDAFSPRRKESVFEFIFVPSPFTIGVAFVKRYKRLAVYKELHNLLLKFPSLKLRRKTKFARRIHGQLVVSVTIQRSCVMRLRFKHSRSCLALLRCIAHLVKRLLAQAVSAMPSVLLCGLLLLAGDVEVNPGPITVEQVLDELRPRFIEEIDANSIVFNLKYMGIISERDLMTITQNNDTIWQNQFLFDHVRSKCNEKALMIFCDEVMSVQSNPRMKAFGEDMKRLLAGKWRLAPVSTRDVSDKAPLSTYDKLRSYYTSTSVIQNSFLVGSVKELDFVNLNLIQPLEPIPRAGQDKASVNLCRGGVGVVPNQKIPLKYEDILHFPPRGNGSRRRVLIEGVPGCGKTTLVKRMCRDWANGSFAEDSKVVIQVILTGLPKRDDLTIEDLVLTSIHDKKMAVDIARYVYYHDGEGVVFVIDGFNEISEEMHQSSIVRDILESRLARKASFLVTSRPISFQSLYPIVDRRIEVIGFEWPVVQRYVRSYFATSDVEVGEQLLSCLDSQPNIKSLCYNPLQLLMVCFTASHEKDLPRTMHELFRRIVILTVNRHWEKSRRRERARSLDDVFQFCPSFFKLAQLALEGLKSDTIVFPNVDFEVDEALLGLMNSFQVPDEFGGTTRMWHFLHLTLQEYFAAYSLSVTPEAVQVQFWSEHLLLKYVGSRQYILCDDRFHTMFLLFCGITGLRSKTGVQAMLVKGADALFRPTIESGSALAALCEAVSESGNRELACRILSPCGSNISVTPLSISGVEWCIEAYGQHVEELHLSISGHKSPSIVAHFFNKMNILTLSGVQLSLLKPKGEQDLPHLKAIAKFLKHQNTLKYLTLSFYSLDSRFAEDEVSCFCDVLKHHCVSLQGVGLKGCRVFQSDIFNILSKLPNLTALTFEQIILPVNEENDRLVTDAISSAMWKHPNLKELTIGCKCSPSLVNGAMEGITRKGGVIKTVIEDDFPAEVVLEELRDQFIGDVEADVVVYELQNKGIIPQGVQARIAAKHSRREKNQILHQHLVETSTKESLIMACGIIIAEAENGYPKMKVLGEAMKKMMEPDSVQHQPAPPTSSVAQPTAPPAPVNVVDFEEAVSRAKDAEVAITVFKVVVLGPPEAGKTQLVSALLGDYNPVEYSTSLSTKAKLVVTRFMKTNESLHWEPLTKDVFQQSVHRFANDKAMDKEAQSSHAVENEPELSNETATPSDSGNVSSREEYLRPDTGNVSSREEYSRPDSVDVSSYCREEYSRPDSGNVSNREEYSRPDSGNISNREEYPRQNSESGNDPTPRPSQASEACSMGFDFENLPKPLGSNKADFVQILKDVNDHCPVYNEERTLEVRYVHLIDNGGQPAFFDAHPVVATSRATYLLVYNMQEGLDAMPQYTYRKRGCSKYEPIPNDYYTNLNLLQASLQTISNLEEKFMTIERKVLDASQPHEGNTSTQPVSYALVVGTRYGVEVAEKEGAPTVATDWWETQRSDAHKKLQEHCTSDCSVWKNVQRCEMDGEMWYLFPVDSRNPDCPGVQEVRKKITSANFGMKLRMSIKWFHCHLLFWHAKEKEKLEVLPFSELFDLCREHELVSDKKDLLDMIRAFHVLGLFFFPALDQEGEEGWNPDDKPVFTNPDFLYGQLTKILEIAFEQQFQNPDGSTGDDTKLFNQLKEDGELTSIIMGRLGIPDKLDTFPGLDFHKYMLDQLSNWGLAAKLPASEDGSKSGTSNEATYFVPCVLRPLHVQGDTPSSTDDPALDPTALCIYLTIYEEGAYYIPNGTFTHFVVNLLSHNPVKYQFRKKYFGVRHRYSDSVDLVRLPSTNPQQSEIRNGYNLRVTSQKLESVKVVIAPRNPNKKEASDYYRIIWDELRVDLAEACNRMYCNKKSANFITVATECPSERGKSHPHLVELAVDKRYLECKPCSAEYELQGLLLEVIRARHDCQEAQGRAQSDDHGMSPSCTALPSAKEVHKEFRKHFIEDVEADVVASELKYNGIIQSGCQEQISRTNDRAQRNRILHDQMASSCTREALIAACEIFIAEEGYPKMKALGDAMKRKLETVAQPTPPTSPVAQPTPPTPPVAQPTPPTPPVAQPTPPTPPVAQPTPPTPPVAQPTPPTPLVAQPTPPTPPGARPTPPTPPVAQPTPPLASVNVSHVQVIKEHVKEFLSEMDAKAIAGTLCVQDYIPPEIKCAISESRSPEHANSCLLEFLQHQADEKQIQGVFQVASAATGYGRMSEFATKLLQKFTQGRIPLPSTQHIAQRQMFPGPPHAGQHQVHPFSGCISQPFDPRLTELTAVGHHPYNVGQHQDTCSLDGHEAFISKSCFVVRGIQSLSVTSEDSVIILGSGKEGSAKLLIPRGAIPPGQELEIRYAILLVGPFSIPEDCHVVSPILYIDYDTSLLKKPLKLCLNHWYAGKNWQKNMTFLKSPHATNESLVFPLEKRSQGSFSDDGQFAVLTLDDLCFVCLAVESTGNCPYPVNCSLYLLKKVQTQCITSFRLYVTYADWAWDEVVQTHIIGDKNWEVAVDAPPQIVTFTDSKDGVKAMFEPNSGNGWEIECQGHQRVPPSQLCNQVNNAYEYLRTQQSDLPREQRHCNLVEEIRHNLYPPCIHYNLWYHHPSARPEVHTTLKISTSHSPPDCLSFTVRIPGSSPVPSIQHIAQRQMFPGQSHVGQHQAEEVLEKYRDQFIEHVHPDAVVNELNHKNIVPQSVQAMIAMKHSRREKNEILHQHLVDTSTRESLIMACGIIIAEAEKGYPKMNVLGEDMKKMLEPGQAAPPPPSTSEGQAVPPPPSTSEGQAAPPPPSSSEGQAVLRCRPVSTHTTPHQVHTPPDPDPYPTSLYSFILQLVLIVAIVAIAILVCLLFVYR